MPQIRSYPQATFLEETDAFVIDREGTGTMFIDAEDLVAVRCITYVVDGGGSEIPGAVVGDLYIPFACTITGATLLADQVGSVEVDIWSDALANYPPLVGDSIVASAPPTITSSDHSQDTTLSGWTVEIPAGNTLRFNVNSVTAITRLTVSLTVSG